MASYQALPCDEPASDTIFVRPPVYYNDGPFSPPSSDDELTVFDKDEDVNEGTSLNGRVGMNGNGDDEEGYPVKRSVGSKPFSATRYLAFSLAALLLLAGGIGIFTAFSYPKSSTSSLNSKLRHITLDHIYNGTFSVEKKYVNWVPEAGDGVFSSADRGVIKLTDLKTNETRELLKFSDVRDEHGNVLPWSEWKLSADMKYVLVKTNYRKQWRHSSFGNYWIHRLSDHHTLPLAQPREPSKIAYATWSPTGNAIAFVEENDLYVLPSADSYFTSRSNTPLRITTKGTSSLFFGVPDWVYEEEVFSSDYTLWWSPSSTHIAFLSLDESKVPDYTFPIYNPGFDSSDVNPYTEFMTMKYPKPGYPNPIVGVLVVDVEGLASKAKGQQGAEVSAEDFVKEVDWEGRMKREDEVIMEVTWVDEGTVLIKEVNRSADEGVVVVVDVKDDGNGRVGAKEMKGKVVRKLGKDGEQGDEGWIDSEQNVYRLPPSLGLSPGAYLDIVPTKDGFNQIALFSSAIASNPTWITSGEEEVTKMLTVDVERRLVYYMVASDTGIGRKLFSASIPSNSDATTDFMPRMTALTDDGIAPPSYYDVSFSPEGGFYLLSYNGPHVPWQKLIKVGDPNFERVYTVNERLNKTVHEYQAPEIIYSTMDSDGYELNTREIRPPNMDTSGRTKYPVLFEVYGGPGSQKVDTNWKRDWHHYLACSLNYVIVSVDGRGTGFKGRRLRSVVKGDLGYWETVDQIAGARFWAEKPYVDSERIGVWGWSYGGFMAAKVVEANAGVHSLAMSVAPVISWRMYDTVYTERYMGLPDENPGGYLNASITDVSPFNGFNYLLAHGSGDDNVHFANTAHLIDMFTQHQVRGYQFRMFTDSDHSITTRSAHREVYEFMTTFLTSHWGKNGARLPGEKKVKEMISKEKRGPRELSQA